MPPPTRASARSSESGSNAARRRSRRSACRAARTRTRRPRARARRTRPRRRCEGSSALSVSAAPREAPQQRPGASARARDRDVRPFVADVAARARTLEPQRELERPAELTLEMRDGIERRVGEVIPLVAERGKRLEGTPPEKRGRALLVR